MRGGAMTSLSYNLAYDAENHLTGVTGAATASFTLVSVL